MRQLARRRLDEVGARGHREDRRPANVVVRPELADLEDHLQMRWAGCLLHADDLVVDLRVAAGEERAAVDHHVDLVGAHRDDLLNLPHLDVDRRLAGRECGRDRRDLDAAFRAGARPRSARGSGRRRRAATDGIDGSDGIRPHRLRAESGHLPGVSCPSSVVRSIIRIASSSANSFDSRLIDRRASDRGTFLDRDLVDGADARKTRLERQLEARGQRGSIGHLPECSPRPAGSRLCSPVPASRPLEGW